MSNGSRRGKYPLVELLPPEQLEALENLLEVLVEEHKAKTTTK